MRGVMRVVVGAATYSVGPQHKLNAVSEVRQKDYAVRRFGEG